MFSNVRLAKHDGEAHPRSRYEQGIKMYPAVKLYHNGVLLCFVAVVHSRRAGTFVSDYTGGRVASELVSWVRKAIGAHSTLVSSPAILGDLLSVRHMQSMQKRAQQPNWRHIPACHFIGVWPSRIWRVFQCR